MPTFIDESGDTGLNPDPANCHFRLAAVWVPSTAEADAIRASIRAVRCAMIPPLSAEFEFKFSKLGGHPDRRSAFFHAVMRHEFRFAVASIDKRVGEWRAAAPAEFHAATSVCLAAALRMTYRTADEKRGFGTSLRELVIVDDNMDRAFLQIVKQKFRGLSSPRGGSGGKGQVPRIRSGRVGSVGGHGLRGGGGAPGRRARPVPPD